MAAELSGKISHSWSRGVYVEGNVYRRIMEDKLESVVDNLCSVKLKPTVENSVGNGCALHKHGRSLPHFVERHEQVVFQCSL